MNGRTRWFQIVVLLMSLGLVMAACGAQEQPTSRPSDEQPASPAGATEGAPPPAPTEAEVLPTEAPLPVAPGEMPDLSSAFEGIQELPGFHFEGEYWGQTTGEQPSYLRFVQDVDAQGNYHLVGYDEEGGEPEFEIYYVDEHLYFGEDGEFMDMGPDVGSFAAMSQVYMAPFQLALVGASGLEAVGHETVNGLAATKYKATYEQWVSAYLQVQEGVSFSAEGFIWISDVYNVIVKSEGQVEWAQEGEEGEYSFETEVSQVGQVAPIEAPEGATTIPAMPAP